MKPDKSHGFDVLANNLDLEYGKLITKHPVFYRPIYKLYFFIHGNNDLLLN